MSQNEFFENVANKIGSESQDFEELGSTGEEFVRQKLDETKEALQKMKKIADILNNEVTSSTQKRKIEKAKNFVQQNQQDYRELRQELIDVFEQVA